MKRILLFLIAFSVGSSLDQPSIAKPLPPEFGMQIGFFYSSLRPHGEWIELESGFHVWRPYHIHNQWRPYLVGRWIWTDDYGWYWMSNEPFGWITYHYGRWYDDDYYGWVWVPDDVWGPAWVEWRSDDDYIGWAPLPPYATFQISFGIRYSTQWVAPAHYWNFVSYHRFGSVIRYRDVVPIEQTRRLIRTTRSEYRYDTNHDRIINRGVDRTIIERRGNVRLSTAEVKDVREQSGERLIRSNGNRQTERIEMYRPSREEMQRGTDRIEAKRGDRPLTLDMNKIERSRTEAIPQRSLHEQPRTTEVQRDPLLRHGSQRQEQPQELKPRVQERKLQRDRKEMRRELIQRYERKQNLSSPATREAPKQRMERQKENSQRERSARTPSERRSSRGGDRQRRE